MAKVTRLLRAIRSYCLSCCGGSRKEADECVIKDCALYRYRLGPNKKK